MVKQAKLVLSLVGVPLPKDVGFQPTADALAFVKHCGRIVRRPIADLLPAVPAAARSLIDKLLRPNPRLRPPARECLQDEWLLRKPPVLPSPLQRGGGAAPRFRASGAGVLAGGLSLQAIDGKAATLEELRFRIQSDADHFGNLAAKRAAAKTAKQQPAYATPAANYKATTALPAPPAPPPQQVTARLAAAAAGASAAVQQAAAGERSSSFREGVAAARAIAAGTTRTTRGEGGMLGKMRRALIGGASAARVGPA